MKLNRLKRSSFYLFPFREINGKRTSTEMQESSRYRRELYVSVLPAGAGRVPSPISSCSHGTSNLMGLLKALPSAGRVEVGTRACIETVLNLTFPVTGSFGHTWSMKDTGSSCPDVCDSRLVESARSPGSFVRSGQ